MDIDFGANEDNENGSLNTSILLSLIFLDINVFIDYCKKSLAPINLNIKKQLFIHADERMEYLGIVIYFLRCHINL